MMTMSKRTMFRRSIVQLFVAVMVLTVIEQHIPLIRVEGFQTVLSFHTQHRVVNGVPSARASTNVKSTAVPETNVASDSSKPSNSKKAWYPTRIQDTVDYDQIVERLYVRHIVTETKPMADMILQNYLDRLKTSDSDDDIFASLAQQSSTCTVTRPEGGKIGWMDRRAGMEIFPQPLLEELYNRQPKAGDLHIIFSTTEDQWHVVQVLECWLKFAPSTHYETDLVGAHSGTNEVISNRPKLKGLGVTPKVPSRLRTYTIQTAGCQMNVADSERLEGVLQNEMGMENLQNSGGKKQKPDLVILNTCSIRDHAQQKVYDALGPYAAAKRQGGDIAIVVTGCVAQQEGQALLKRIPEVDAVIGPQYVPFLAGILDRVTDGGDQVVATSPMLIDEQSDTSLSNPPVRGHSVRAWVNIIFGCNEHCTYCVVPGTRGMEQSRSMETVLKECKQLQSQGYKEVTLLGQNIDAYGRDMTPKRTFADLLHYLDSRLKGMRIRYVTSHPRYFSDRVIDAVANLPQLCECFHMPFQAGDDEVLRSMRRGYTYDSYMRIIRKIREKSPEASICADVIVGFPGETEEAFERTLDLMREVKFDNLNSFAYSPRPNTEAALWSDRQIDEETKAKRLQRVQELATQHGMERSMQYVGKVVPVLVEDVNPRNARQVMGRTRQGRQVYFNGDLQSLRGMFCNVHIVEARTWSLIGQLVQANVQDVGPGTTTNLQP